MAQKSYLAMDLGAESGRVILGTLEGGRLTLEEIHRFPTGASRIGGSLRWNLLRIFEELKVGLRKVAALKVPVESLSVDSWGVDYVLFNTRQPMLSLPYHYRDERTGRTFPAALEKAGREKIFGETGIQFMAINTLYHLIADVEENPDVLDIADQFLNIADYLNYLFSGVARNEVSTASTTQMYNPVTGGWSKALIETFGLPSRLFPKIVPSGTRLGPLQPELCAETGLAGVEVVASCSHDTGAAVAAVPADSGDDWAYLSSGTWSLIGVELPSPIIHASARELNFTNEAGYGGTTRFLKNIVGLWLLQESRRAWAFAGRTLEYAEIMALAEQAEPFRSIIDPNDERFVRPEHMPAAIAGYCRGTGQPEPETPGQFARCILESLALQYRHTLTDLEQLTGRRITRLHIVGGGSQSALLNQFAADATGRTVLAGPVEATATGNVLIQSIALGHLHSLAELRAVTKNSFTIQQFEPKPGDGWENAIVRFETLIS
jgi:rhamnulokinase